MPLGTEVCLGPDDIVLDENPAPPATKRGHSPQFSAHVCCGQTDALSYTAQHLLLGEEAEASPSIANTLWRV